jgi:hypothetical protein
MATWEEMLIKDQIIKHLKETYIGISSFNFVPIFKQ